MWKNYFQYVSKSLKYFYDSLNIRGILSNLSPKIDILSSASIATGKKMCKNTFSDFLIADILGMSGTEMRHVSHSFGA